jgi:hypothetical protein
MWMRSVILLAWAFARGGTLWLIGTVDRHGPQSLAVVLLNKDPLKLRGNLGDDCRIGPVAMAVVSRHLDRQQPSKQCWQ